jgi:Protein of unknown function (DUF3102)
MTQAMLKLVEGEPDALAVLMMELRAKAEADQLAVEGSLAAVVDEIELALSEEHGQLEELRQLARLRDAAAHQHAIRIGRLLLQAKRKIPHGQFQAWIKEQGFDGCRTASQYMHIAKTSRRAGR